MTTEELLALSSTKSPEQLGQLLADLRRERRALEPTYRSARRDKDGVALIQTTASIRRLDHQMARVRYELASR
jgi:hypothetical protein